MMEFNYQGATRVRKLVTQAFGVFGILLFTLFAGFIFSGIWIVPQPNHAVPWLNDPRVTIFCFAVWTLLISWTVGLLFIDLFPTIWLSDDGLLISTFLIFRKKIHWEDIIDLGQGSPPKHFILVRAKKISPFHRLFGWVYARSFYPAFLIHKDINNYYYLISELRKRVGRIGIK